MSSPELGGGLEASRMAPRSRKASRWPANEFAQSSDAAPIVAKGFLGARRRREGLSMSSPRARTRPRSVVLKVPRDRRRIADRSLMSSPELGRGPDARQETPRSLAADRRIADELAQSSDVSLIEAEGFFGARRQRDGLLKSSPRAWP
jgi:hypothetical protein